MIAALLQEVSVMGQPAFRVYRYVHAIHVQDYAHCSVIKSNFTCVHAVHCIALRTFMSRRSNHTLRCTKCMYLTSSIAVA
jgi:hypothetical protein